MNKKTIFFYTIVLSGACLLVFLGCKKEEDPKMATFFYDAPDLVYTIKSIDYKEFGDTTDQITYEVLHEFDNNRLLSRETFYSPNLVNNYRYDLDDLKYLIVYRQTNDEEEQFFQVSIHPQFLYDEYGLLSFITNRNDIDTTGNEILIDTPGQLKLFKRDNSFITSTFDYKFNEDSFLISTEKCTENSAFRPVIIKYYFRTIYEYEYY